MLFLITGCGRSGTGWAAELFGCHHERQFTPARHGPLREPESSWLAVPYLDELPAETQIIRIIRNPYDVVDSAVRKGFLAQDHQEPYGLFAERHCPQIGVAEEQIGRVIRWVTHWDAPLNDRPHAALQVDGGGGISAAGRRLISGHPDEHLIHERAERWRYM